MLKGFKEFVLRGNVLDLAVAVVIGGASARWWLPGEGPAHAAHRRDRRQTRFLGARRHGERLAVSDRRFSECGIAFLLVAAAVYFFVVAPMKR